MKTMETTPQPFFEKSISILFLFGQLPVIVISCIIILAIDGIYDTKKNWYLTGVYSSALLALALSMAAVSFRSSQNTARRLLYFSMAATLIYLTCLVRVTSGSTSPFQHLYLYMPAVVFMVTQRDRKAEWICSIGVFMSFCFNYGNTADWDAWKSFHSSEWFGILEIANIGALLFLLSLVNKQIEQLVKIDS